MSTIAPAATPRSSRLKPNLSLPSNMKEYVVVRYVAEGAGGQVFVLKRGGKAYACKVLEYSGEGAKATVDMEASIHKHAVHDNVIHFYDAIPDIKGGRLFVLMELGNQDLFAFIRLYRPISEPIPESIIWDIFSRVVSAVHHLHTPKEHEGHLKCVVHGDIKASNILMVGGIPKLCDFGGSRRFDIGDTRSMVYEGTEVFHAPEIGPEAGACWLAAELWALGHLLYELLFEDPADIDEITETAPLKFEIPSCYSTNLRQTISQLLSYNPDDRPTTSELMGKFEISVVLKSIENKKEEARLQKWAAELQALSVQLNSAAITPSIPDPKRTSGEAQLDDGEPADKVRIAQEAGAEPGVVNRVIRRLKGVVGPE